MPFLTYQVSVEDAMRNAGRLMKEGGAHAVKLEGGEAMAPTVARLVSAGIPVQGHIGLTPQSIHQLGGYRVQGRTRKHAKRLLLDALALEAAGAFSIVLEGVPAELARLITQRLTVPTIGIGAGPYCDGQVQVFHDFLGFYPDFVPKHAKQYAPRWGYNQSSCAAIHHRSAGQHFSGLPACRLDGRIVTGGPTRRPPITQRLHPQLSADGGGPRTVPVGFFYTQTGVYRHPMSTEHQDSVNSRRSWAGSATAQRRTSATRCSPSPRAMSTQHPDNARSAPFSENGVLKGEGEIAEAHYVYSTLGCDEQMWDYEGKAADVDVVLKLLLHDPAFFNANKLGQQIFLTLRIPNPAVERELRKKVEEALHNIVTSYDVASGFYNAPTAPIFQVILPFTTSAEEIVWVDSYYQEVVVGKQRHRLPGGQRVSEWMGEYRPESIQVIPLLEDRERLSQVDTIIERYLQLVGRPMSNLRVFLARSDPAMNYGMVSAALLAKIALQRLHHLEQRTGVAIYPIIGVGGVPFRGNFRPNRVEPIPCQLPQRPDLHRPILVQVRL